MKLPATLPLAILQIGAGVGFTMGPPVILHVVSSVEKPLPVTVSVIPVTPEVGDSRIFGPATVNVAWAESPVEPVTVTVYVPGDTPPTKKLPLGAPLPEVIVHVGVMARVLGPILQKVSPNEKPVPVTVTADPTAPVVGERVILAVDVVEPVIVKDAEAESWVIPVTVIVYVPGVVALTTLNPAPANCPLVLIVHVEFPAIPGAAGACEMTQVPASPRLNPPPLIVTVVPNDPEGGVSVIAGAGIVKLACAVSPTAPVTVTV